MMEKIKAGEITGQTGDYMLRATAANGQIRAFAATSRGGESQTGAQYQPGGDRSAGTPDDGRGHDGIDDESGP